MLFAIGVAFAAVYATYLGALYLLQDRLVFPVPGGISREALDTAAREGGAQPVDLVADDGVALYGWHLGAGGDRLVIYLPGNAETVADNVGLQRLLTRSGFSVFALAYRGYPGSAGEPTEAGIVRDVLAAWEWATEEAGYDPQRIVVHGRSLGGGAAAHLAEQRNPAGLVLESTFVSVSALAARAAPLAPVQLLLRHPFDTRTRAPRLGVPTLVMHSTGDQVIPVELGGRALHPYLAEGEYHETSGLGHHHTLPVSDPALREVYLAFLERQVPRRDAVR